MKDNQLVSNRFLTDLKVKELKKVAAGVSGALGVSTRKISRKPNEATGRKRKTFSHFGRENLMALFKQRPNFEQRLTYQLRLKNAIKKVLRKESPDERVRRMRIVQKALRNASSCLSKYKTKLGKAVWVIVDNNNEPLAFEIKGIGSKSANGTAHLFALGNPKTNGTNLMLKSLVTFVVKRSRESYHNERFERWTVSDDHEKAMLKHMTEIFEKKLFPNFPLMYRHGVCKNQYAMESIIVNEVAHGDLQTHIKGPEAGIIYYSICQGLIAIAGFHHFMGYPHNDSHGGNFLVHKITPGGQWHYQIHGLDVYIPNMGYQVVIWDPLVFRAYDSNGNRVGNVSRWPGSVKDMYEKEDYKKYFHSMVWYFRSEPEGSTKKEMTRIFDDIAEYIQQASTPRILWEYIVKNFNMQRDPSRPILNAKPYVVGSFP